MNNSTQPKTQNLNQLSDQEFVELSLENQYKYLQNQFPNAAIDWKYSHNVVICERSKTVVEPLISQEFFVDYYKEFEHSPVISPDILAKVAATQIKKVDKNEDGSDSQTANFSKKTKTTLQKLALEGIDEVEFLPIEYQERATKYFGEIKNWCISRDLIWGHKMPIWYNLDWNPDRVFYTFQEFQENKIVKEFVLNNNSDSQTPQKIQEKDKNQPNNPSSEAVIKPETSSNLDKKIIHVQDCFQISPKKPINGNWVQETKILDTWFSSTLWPLSTLDFAEFVQKDQKIKEIDTEIDILVNLFQKLSK